MNLTIFGISVVDTWLAYVGCRGAGNTETQNEFYALLAEEMIENTLDMGPTAGRRSSGDLPDPIAASVTGGVGAHLTPTKRRRIDKQSKQETAYAYQGYCTICTGRKSRHKTTFTCSLCRDNGAAKEVFLCPTRCGRDCFLEHMRLTHGDE